jgi:Domain of unknown function (DUF6817)
VSHLAILFTLADLDSYTRRWNTEWYVPSMAHLAKKWRFVPNADLLNDYLSDFLEKRERCLLRLDTLRSAPPASAANLRVDHTIAGLLERMEALGYDSASVAKVRETHAVAAQLFGANHHASGSPLLAYLAGMASILAAYGANPTVIAAALFGEAYAQGQFPKGFDRNVAAKRRWLQRRVGDRVEKLAFTYSCLRPDSAARFLPDDLDDMPISLANAAIMKIADEIENRHAGARRLFDTSAWRQDSSEPLVRWMPAFIAAAGRTGFGEMLNVLQELAAKTPPDTIAAAVRPVPPLNFILESTGGANRPLSLRNVVEADGRAPAVAGGNRHAIKLGAIAAVNGGSARRAGDCTIIETAQRAWTYSAEVRLPRHIRQTGPAVIEIRLQADQGEIGAMVLERDSSVFALVPEQSVAAGPEPSMLYFDIAAIEEAGQLVFRGWPDDDGAAKARIFEISLVSGAPARSIGCLIRDGLAALTARLRLS